MIKQGRLDTKYNGIADCFRRTLADEGEHHSTQTGFFKISCQDLLSLGFGWFERGGEKLQSLLSMKQFPVLCSLFLFTIADVHPFRCCLIMAW